MVDAGDFHHSGQPGERAAGNHGGGDVLVDGDAAPPGGFGVAAYGAELEAPEGSGKD